MTCPVCNSLRSIVPLTLLATLAATHSSAQTYTIHELPPPNPSGNSYGIGINEAGVVVGQGLTSSGDYRALRWVNAVPTDLGALPGDAGSLAFDISNDNRGVGVSGSRCSSTDPAFWANNQIWALPDVARATVGVYRVNDFNTAIGEGFDSCTRPWNNAAYRWDYLTQDAIWAVTPLAPLIGDPEASACDVSDSGIVVGYSGDSSGAAHLRAVRWEWDDFVLEYRASLVPDLGGDYSIARATNNAINGDGQPARQVAGYSRTTDGRYRAYFWDGAVAIDLGTLPGYAHSAATRLNSAGTVIGHAFNGTGEAIIWPYSIPNPNQRASVWRNGALCDVNNLIPAGSGWTSLNGLRDINERGQITGYGVRAGRYRAFLLTPAYGDLNCDGAVDNGDIDAFVLALTDRAGYGSAYPDCDVSNGDTNEDGSVDNGDIDSFVACLLGGGCD